MATSRRFLRPGPWKAPWVATAEPCYRCGREAKTTQGTIYVRREVDGHWQSVPICQEHWDEEQPNREPVRVRPD